MCRLNNNFTSNKKEKKLNNTIKSPLSQPEAFQQTLELDLDPKALTFWIILGSELIIKA